MPDSGMDKIKVASIVPTLSLDQVKSIWCMACIGYNYRFPITLAHLALSCYGQIKVKLMP